jgi:non-heme chloroperoxidase
MQRRELLKGLAAAGGLALGPNLFESAQATAHKGAHQMRTPIDLFVKDWGSGSPLVFVHSWAVDNDIFQYQHHHFVEAGHRVVAYDRRGHGRSAQPGAGYDIATLADDLARVIAERDLTDATLIGHSMGAKEIVAYLARHGTSKVARAVLVAPTTPFLLKTADNPEGVDGAMFEALRNLWRQDFPGWLRANARPFFVPQTSDAMVDWGVAMMSRTPVHVAVASNRSMVEHDSRAECRAVTVPTLIVHGTKDASAPLALTGQRTAALIPRARFVVYEDAPHGLMFTHADRLNADIAAFIANT